MTGYRIHRPEEPLESLLDPRRVDGWSADDESADSQPVGVSCCLSVEDLRRYVVAYSMAVVPGSLLVELQGSLGGNDRDDHAARLIVRSYRVIGHGDRFVAAAQARRTTDWRAR